MSVPPPKKCSAVLLQACATKTHCCHTSRHTHTHQPMHGHFSQNAVRELLSSLCLLARPACFAETSFSVCQSYSCSVFSLERDGVLDSRRVLSHVVEEGDREEGHNGQCLKRQTPVKSKPCLFFHFQQGRRRGRHVLDVCSFSTLFPQAGKPLFWQRCRQCGKRCLMPVRRKRQEARASFSRPVF